MHYVLSDIHGHYDKFVEILNKINYNSDEDSMYILGDVIDRGPDGIKCLLHIKNDKSMHLLMGNHEDMMIRTYKQKVNRTLYNEDWWRLWLHNGSRTTTKGMKSLSEEEQKDLLAWLKTLPLVIPNLVVGDKSYYLVHACNIRDEVKDVLYYNDADDYQIDTCLWDRLYGSLIFVDYFDKCFRDVSEDYKNRILIVGHTPVECTDYARYEGADKSKPKIARLMDGQFFNVDCGCAGDYRLGCLCLETEEEFYSK